MMGFIGVIVIIIIILSTVLQKKSKWVSRDDFEREKKKLKPNFSEKELDDFMIFLKEYQGGYVKRRSGQIIYQDFTGKEKGDLKGIFWNLVFTNRNLEVKNKENFRKYLNAIGVKGLEKRPQYETRDSKLVNYKTGEEYLRKEVGNAGEKIVREELEKLEIEGYLVINGPVLEYGGTKREYDHIVIGSNGVFCVETKAFGMTDGQSVRASLFIDPGDKWIVRKNKVNKEVVSPTDQIISAKKHLESIIMESHFVEIYSILALSNSEIYIKNNIKLPYNVVRIDELCDCIKNKKDELISAIDMKMIAMSIDKYRKN